MRSFLFKLILFLLPVAAVYAFPLLFFIYGREFMSVAEVVRTQQQATSTVLYQLAYDDSPVAYKIAGTIAHDPSMIAIGTSRATQFRSEFFADPTAFYNAGSILTLADDIRFVKALPQDAKLKVIIFDAEPAYLTTKITAMVPENTTHYALVRNFFTNGWWKAYRDYFEGKFTLSDLAERSRVKASIGIAALMHDTGYRNDGSHKPVPHTDEERLASLHNEIAQNVEDISSSQDMDEEILPSHVQELEQFLSLCKERDIYVIGIVPPYASEVRAALTSLDTAPATSSRAAYAQFASTFASYSYPFYDISSLPLLGSSDEELLDVGHGSEKAYLRILIYLAKYEPRIASKLRTDVKKLLLKSTSDVEVL